MAVADGSPPLAMHDGRVVLGRNEILGGIDFTLERGEFVVLLGGNGSGKTTLVKALLGLVPMASGRVELFGVELDRFRARELIGYVPQRIAATSGVPASVMEVVLSGRAARVGLLGRYSRDDRLAAGGALEALDLHDLAADPVSTLSSGQQQRVLIARALAGEPQVLVLDEPVASVDLAHQESFAHILTQLGTRGTSVLLVAHGLGAMQKLVHRAVVLSGGRIVHDGPPVGHDIFAEHHHHPHPEMVPEPERRL